MGRTRNRPDPLASRWWDPAGTGRPRPCTCDGGPCEGGPDGCGYEPAEWEGWTVIDGNVVREATAPEPSP